MSCISHSSMACSTSWSRILVWPALTGILLFAVGCDYAQIYEGYVVEDTQASAREVPPNEKLELGTLSPAPEVWIRIATPGDPFDPMRAAKDGHWRCAQLWGSPSGKIYPLNLLVEGSGYEAYSTRLLLNDSQMKHTIIARIHREPN